MKTFIKITLLLCLIVYLIFAFTNFTGKGDSTICKSVNYTIVDSLHAGFITEEVADNLLRKSGNHPVGRRMDQVDGLAIERSLRQNSFIDSVLCYKSPGGLVNIIIGQRIPLMRIMSDNGENYYLDENGHRMQTNGYAADLVVATGQISHAYAARELVKLGRFLREDEFWNNQIEQIQVTPEGRIRLYPRVGSHTIIFGTTDSISRKFRNLYTFYEKVLPSVGWNKYSEISVEHTTQIVGRKGKS